MSTPIAICFKMAHHIPVNPSTIAAMGEFPVCKCPHTIKNTLALCRGIKYEVMEAPGLRVLGQITHQHIVPLTRYIIDRINGHIQKILDK